MTTQRRTAAVDLRVQAVERMLVEGASRSDIRQMAAEQWGASPRTVDRLIAAARQEIREDWNIQRPDAAAVLLSQAATIYQRALAKDDLGAALGALKLTAKLAQLI